MKKHFLTTAVFATTMVAARADVHYSFNYDSVPSGNPASLFDTFPLSTTYAILAPDVDGFGSDIPGTDRWRPDVTAPPVTVDDPTLFGSSTTSSPNALNAKFQPVLLSFALSLSSLQFSLRLDGDTYGDPSADILFLDANGATLQSLPVDQTQPGALLSLTGLSGVTGILLPGGAFYDNLSLDAVPEAGTWAAIVTASALTGWQSWRRRRTQAVQLLA